MRHFWVTAIVTTLLSLPAFATIHIVNNNPAHTGAFTTLQSAHDAAASGDTIYVIGSGIVYSTLTTSKPLVWIGPGYFLTNNPETQVNASPAQLYNLYVNAGSQGSLFMGLLSNYDVQVNSYSILFKRCSFSKWGSAQIYLNSSSNIMFDQCWIEINYAWAGNRAIYLQTSSNVSFTNCIMKAYNNSHVIWTDQNSGPVEFRNNVVYGRLQAYNANASNSIFINEFQYSGSINFLNCITHNTALPAGNSNQNSIVPDSIFVGGTSPDGQYMVRAGSAASGAGVGGIDCGAFGGTHPYVISGIPNIPTITYFDSPSSAAAPQGLPVIIRARARN